MLGQWKEPGREVAVVGLGKSGLAAGLLLREHGVAVYASDSGSSERHLAWATALEHAGAAVDLGHHDLARIARAVAVVVAPGVPPDVPPLQEARAHGVPVYAEADLGLTELPDTTYVAVTGTNGKTTTTALVGQLLAAAGYRVETAGNIGTAVCEVAREPDPPGWLALELSSFQLHDMPHVAPTVGILTNLSPNHLDRYASLAEYYGDKARLFRNATTQSIWVVNRDDAAALDMVRGVAGRHLTFSVRQRADGWFDRDRQALMLGDTALLRRADLPLLGDHNVANALAAALAARAVGADPEAIAAGLQSFRAIPHRMEPVREVGGVLWINDSKSTNIASTEVAVAALTRPFVLLLGGRHKGEPYTGLGTALEGHCRLVIAYGEAGPLIERDLAGAVPVERGTTFEDVLARAARAAKPGDAVLLSPACSSYDMFRNYEERGVTFRAWVSLR
jgi:UDP-N-acetylmuramoylalanine--D-glutamate ligase